MVHYLRFEEGLAARQRCRNLDFCPGISTFYFLLQAGMADYRTFEEGRDAGDFSMLPELHASLSALKVHLSWSVSVMQHLVCQA